jgi:membrane protein
MRQIRHFGVLLERTGQKWLDHEDARIGAALAFYTLLAFAPLIMLSITAGSLLFPAETFEPHLIREVNQLAGGEAAKLAQVIIDKPRPPAAGLMASFLGLATLLFGASGVFAELRGALNTIWNIPPQPGNGILLFLKGRLLSVGMVMAGGFLLVVSLVVSAVLAVLGKYVSGVLPAPAPLLEGLNFVLSLAGSAWVFALVLRYVPDVRLPWRTVGWGALMTAFLFTAGKSLIGLYLGTTAIGSPYGPGGSIMVVMAWVYYSVQIFLFGAEFTRTIAPAGLHSDIVTAVANGGSVGKKPALK